MKNILLILILISCVSCFKASYFKIEDNKFIKKYKVGDILVFKNVQSNKVKQYKISKINKYHTRVELMAGSKSFHTVDIFINNGKEFMTFTKIDKEIILFFQGSRFHELNNYKLYDKKLNLSLSNNKFENIIEIKSSYNTDDTSPIIIYWDKEFGIIKYETKNGEIWERTNF